MPSINDMLIPDRNLEGYAPVAAPRPAPVQIPAPVSNTEPGRNAMLRCPMPPLWQVSPDALRQFYVSGQVPQARIMLPAPPSGASTSVSTVENVQITSSATSGGSGSASTGSSLKATSASLTTPVLPPGNKFVGTALLAKSFQILSLSAQSSCRIQLYGTAAAQSADLTRALDAAPAAGTAQNIIADVVLDTAPYAWYFQNRVGANADSTQSTKVYVTVTNLDQTSDTETITFQFVPLES